MAKKTTNEKNSVTKTANDNTVTDNTVTDNTVADSNVTDNAIADNTVTNNTVADNTVMSNNVADSPVTDNTIADSTVADNTVTDNDVTDNTVTDNTVTDNTVTDNTVTDSNVTDNTVTDNTVEDIGFVATEINGESENNDTDTATAQKEKKSINKFVTRYFIDAFSGMALGLFCTLIVGTIISTIGTIIGKNAVGNVFSFIGTAVKTVMGAGIGVGIAHSFKAKKLTSFTAAAAGMVGANITNIFVLSGIKIWGASSSVSIGIGDPVASYVSAVFCIEIANLVEGKTPVDIIVVPLVGIFVGVIASIIIGIPFGMLFALLGKGVAKAVQLEPISFGIIISAIMGILLTLPTSSAAFGVMIFGSSLITGNLTTAGQLAAGAACAGCCAHMVGFAVASFRENGVGGLISQGVGTSMLQIPNLAKNPRILIPAVVASIVAGPLSSAAFGLMCDSVGAGMGTAGFVGIIQTFTTSIASGLEWWYVLIAVLVCYVIVPAGVAFGVSELMRKKKWIKFGDMKLPK